MNALNLAVKEAIEASGASKEANKAYLEFIKANFIIPIEQHSNDDNPEVLFLQDKVDLFLPVFSEMEFLNNWASEINSSIKLLKLSAVDLLKGMGENVTLCLDIGSDHYKEFNPAETARMRSMVLKLFK
ncbi:MAG: SseB family protein [Legionellales bacterium]